jgi:hypothetical protein
MIGIFPYSFIKTFYSLIKSSTRKNTKTYANKMISSSISWLFLVMLSFLMMRHKICYSPPSPLSPVSVSFGVVVPSGGVGSPPPAPPPVVPARAAAPSVVIVPHCNAAAVVTTCANAICCVLYKDPLFCLETVQ